MAGIKFTETNIRNLFGPEAAEDENTERLKEYYFKGDVFEKIHNDLPIRILVGHKGIGKSATFKVSYCENVDKNNITIWIRPDDIIELCQDRKNVLQMIIDWKNGLSNMIFSKTLDYIGIQNDTSKGKVLNRFGNITATLLEVFKTNIEEKANIDPIKSQIISKYQKNHKIYVYIDDLDRGWNGDTHDVARISALLNAARDLTNENEGLCIRVSIRSDVYFLVRTSDESTDKIEGSVIWYTWTQHQILIMLAKRVQYFLGNKINEKQLLRLPQFKIAELFYEVFEERFTGRGKWSDVPTHKVLASLIRRRPRDLVKLCTFSARTAYENNHDKITTNDLMDNFDYYSQERIQDTINEYCSELPDIERLLLGFKPSNRERHSSDVFIYTSEELMKKINIITGNIPFQFSCVKRGRTSRIASEQELAAFLYKINFLVARKKVEDSDYIDRRYFEDHKYLSNRFIDFGYKWEVHPAFRWALYPDSGNEIYSTLSIDNEI